MGSRETTVDLAQRIHEYAEGNPLFIIESVRAGQLESGFADGHSGGNYQPDESTENRFGASPVPIPPRIFAVIQSRVKQLAPGPAYVAQVAATIGRACDVPLLARAAQRSEDSALADLDVLWNRRIIHEDDSMRYDFTHDRIRDVVYMDLSPVRRQLLHRQVANALVDSHRANWSPFVHDIAFHCERAHDTEKATEFYRQAANVARQLYAHRDVAAYLEKALEGVRSLPDPGNSSGRVSSIC